MVSREEFESAIAPAVIGPEEKRTIWSYVSQAENQSQRLINALYRAVYAVSQDATMLEKAQRFDALRFALSGPVTPIEGEKPEGSYAWVAGINTEAPDAT